MKAIEFKHDFCIWSTSRINQRIARWLGWQDLSLDKEKRETPFLWKDPHGYFHPHVPDYAQERLAVTILTALWLKGWDWVLLTEPENGSIIFRITSKASTEITFQTEAKEIAEAITATVLAAMDAEAFC